MAGHLPPLLVHPDGTNEYLEVQPSPPLGIIDDGVVETTRHQIEDGSLFVLYTDGLVESRDRDISEGLDRLQVAFGEGAPEKDLEDLCKTALDGVYSDAKRDDIAVLIAKLRRIPEDHRISFPLEPELSSVRQARSMIRDPLKRWGLEDLIPVTELLVSELVTNAIKYAHGETLLQLILEPDTLTCEVHDTSPALPRVLQVDKDAENGRGLHVVSQLSARWGARRSQGGKVVWCEQPVPRRSRTRCAPRWGSSPRSSTRPHGASPPSHAARDGLGGERPVVRPVGDGHSSMTSTGYMHAPRRLARSDIRDLGRRRTHPAMIRQPAGCCRNRHRARPVIVDTTNLSSALLPAPP